MRARIFQQKKSATQSGNAHSEGWMLDYAPDRRLSPDPLMGWMGQGNTQAQVHLYFATQEEAVAYAQRNAIPYDLETPAQRHRKPKVYADNFKYDRPENWTH